MEDSSVGNAGMEQMIPLINSLQDAFQQTGQKLDIDLPQVSFFTGVDQLKKLASDKTFP